MNGNIYVEEKIDGQQRGKKQHSPKWQYGNNWQTP